MSRSRLKIVHLCPTPLSGAPVHLSGILNKYSPCESKTVLKRRFSSAELTGLHWPYDVVDPSEDQLQEILDWADIIHYHRNRAITYPIEAGDKRSVIQFHSLSDEYVAGQTLSEYNGRKLVVAQFQPRIYTDGLIVPNMIDIWDPMFLPAEKPLDRIKVFYSWASEQKGGWNDKGSEQTLAILQRLQAKYGSQIEVCVVTNRPYRECMAEKRTAHLCIDECATGSYHQQSLEAASFGAVTLNNIDGQTLACMRAVNGQNSHPFARTNLEELFGRLCFFIENPETLLKTGQAARKWMEEHWAPEKLVDCYLNAYVNLWEHNTVTPARASETSVPATERSNRGARQTPRKSVRELYQKFQGEDIYVFGSGPSLFRINPEEFRDKICLGINYTFEAMPYMDFYLFHDYCVYEVLKDILDHEKFLMPEKLVEVERLTGEPQERRDLTRWIPVQNNRAYFYAIQNPYERTIDYKSVSLEKDARIFTWSTTTHSAIHLAAYMGAKNIYLIGVDHTPYADGRAHFDSRYDPNYGAQSLLSKNHRKGDEWLAHQLMQHGVRVENIGNRYHPNDKKILL